MDPVLTALAKKEVAELIIIHVLESAKIEELRRGNIESARSLLQTQVRKIDDFLQRITREGMSTRIVEAVRGLARELRQQYAVIADTEKAASALRILMEDGSKSHVEIHLEGIDAMLEDVATGQTMVSELDPGSAGRTVPSRPRTSPLISRHVTSILTTIQDDYYKAKPYLERLCAATLELSAVWAARHADDHIDVWDEERVAWNIRHQDIREDIDAFRRILMSLRERKSELMMGLPRNASLVQVGTQQIRAMQLVDDTQRWFAPQLWSEILYIYMNPFTQPGEDYDPHARKTAVAAFHVACEAAHAIMPAINKMLKAGIVPRDVLAVRA